MTIKIRRGLALLAVDIVAWAAAVAVATLARWEFAVGSIDWSGVLAVAAIGAVAQFILGLALGLYTGRMRLSSFEEAGALTAVAGLIGISLFVWLVNVSGPRPVPLGVSIAGPAVYVILALGVRFVLRLWRESQAVSNHERASRAIIFGAGEAGEEVARALLGDPESGLLPVAFLDDDPAKLGLRIKGRRVVGGREAMALAVEEHAADTLVIAFPSGTRHQVAEVARAARNLSLQVLILPRMARLLETDIGVGHIRDLRFGDFLGRDEIDLDMERMGEFVAGRRVLVTGAGGSIGAELCAALLQFRPAELFMVDRDENALHALQLRLEGRALLSNESLIVADVREADRIEQVMRQCRPDVVLHAAALKHLPFLERYVAEGVKTNVLGTLNVLEAASRAGVHTFVNVSTDKAANPVSVLGLTKRVGERLTAGFAFANGMVALSVRFGNVLGTRGSVVPTMRHQIVNGGPVTITDPEVSRYFMTLEEAVQLVLQAGAVGQDGEVLVLEMGEPVLIEDLARELMAEIRPGEEIGIEYTGLRQGEKLTEVLVSDDDSYLGSRHEGIASYAAPPLRTADLEPLQWEEDPEVLRQVLERLAWAKGPPVRTPIPERLVAEGEQRR